MASIRVLLAWSSGKDSAWTLHVLRQEPDVEVVGLLTTFTISRDGFCFTDLVHGKSPTHIEQAAYNRMQRTALPRSR